MQASKLAVFLIFLALVSVESGGYDKVHLRDTQWDFPSNPHLGEAFCAPTLFGACYLYIGNGWCLTNSASFCHQASDCEPYNSCLPAKNEDQLTGV